MADYRKMARRAAIRAGIDPDIFERQIGAESGFNPGARSPAGAAGIAQIMPDTAKGWGVDPMDPEAALGAAARNMAQYVKKYGGYENALRAYNAGPAGIQASHAYAETNAYVKKILNGETPTAPTGGSSESSTAGQSGPTTRTVPSFDQEGFDTAQKRALLARLWQSQGSTKDNPLFQTGLLSTAPVDASQFAGTRTVTTGGTSTGGGSRTTGGGNTLVVGDSLGVGTAPFLQKDLGGHVAADVKVGRPSSNAVKVLQQKLAGGNYSRIVFDAGTNDGSAAQLRQSIQQVKKMAGGAEVYIPTVNGPGASAKNQIIRQMAGGNVHVVDWAGNARGLGGDGIHATPQGYQSRAQLIAQAMGGGSVNGGSVNTSGKGTATFEGHKVAAWIEPALEYARQHGWKGQVNSGYRSFEDQTRIYNSGVRPAAKPGTSNHEGAEFPRGAVDVSNAQQLSQILAKSPWRKKLKWAGAKDPVHFSFPHNGSY